jgi:hypothetical protein
MGSDNLTNVEWSKTELPATTPKNQLERVHAAMLALTSLVFVARIAVRLFKRKLFELQDFFIALSYVCYVAMVVMYFEELDPLYRAEGVQRGEIPPYASICEQSY